MLPQPLALLEGLLGVLQQALVAPQKEVRENAQEIEELVRRHQRRELSDDRLLAEIDARRERMRRLLKARQVKHGGRMDRQTLGLLERLRERLVAKMAGGASVFLLIAQEWSGWV